MAYRQAVRLAVIGKSFKRDVRVLYHWLTGRRSLVSHLRGLQECSMIGLEAGGYVSGYWSVI